MIRCSLGSLCRFEAFLYIPFKVVSLTSFVSSFVRIFAFSFSVGLGRYMTYYYLSFYGVLKTVLGDTS